MKTFLSTVAFWALMCASSTGWSLVGGTKVPIGLYPSIVLIDDCTATKVGDYHFLLAAHCVVDGAEYGGDDSYANQLKPGFGEEATLPVSRSPIVVSEFR